MSHITLEEYIASLPQSLSETKKVEKANEWKQKHQPKEEKVEVETIEEVKEPAVAEKDTTVTAETTKVSEDLDSGNGTLPSTKDKEERYINIIDKSKDFSYNLGEKEYLEKYAGKKSTDPIVSKTDYKYPKSFDEYAFEIDKEILTAGQEIFEPASLDEVELKDVKSSNWEKNFIDSVKSTKFKDLDNNQLLILQEKALKELEKDYSYYDDYSFDDTDIKLKALSIFENKIIPELSQEKDTKLEAFTKDYVPILNPYADFISDLYTSASQGFKTSGAVDPTFQLLKNGVETSDEDIIEWININKKIASETIESDEMRDFNKIYQKNGSGILGFIKGAAKNPSILPSLLISSATTQIGSLLTSEEVALAAGVGAGTGAAVGAGAGAIGGPLAGITASGGAIAGAIAGGAGAMEAALTFSELLQEEVGDDLSLEAVKKLFEDEERVNDLKKKAIARGVTIGLVEGITGGISKGVTGKLLKAGLSKPVSGVAGFTVEAIGGSTGEILGRVAAGQNQDVAEILFEGVTGLGSAPLTVGSELVKLNNTISNYKLKQELKNTDFEKVSQAFNPEFPTTSFEIKASQEKNSLEIIDKEVDLDVREGNVTKEQGNNIKNRARQVQGAVNQLKPLDVSVENQPAIVDLIIEQKNLKNTIKQVDNSSLTKAESARLSEIDTELGDLITQDKSKKIDVGAKKIAEEIGVGFEAFNTQEDVDSAIATLQEEGGEIDTKNSDNYGTFVVLPDGRRIIILNKETATEDRAFTEGQHETAHAITYETVKNNPEAAIALGQSLLNEIRTNKDINIKPGFQARLDQYIQDADISQADTMEEVMTLVSDGLTDGTIEINETIGVKLGNFIRRALSAMGMKVKFKNGKDVLNFIKDYNRSVHRQQGLSKGLKKTAIEGAEVTITPEAVTETEIKESVAKESKRQVNPAEEAAGYQVDPLAAFLAADVKSGEKTNEQLIVDAAPKNEATPRVRIASQDALVEANWPVISKALKIDPTGEIPLPFIKLAVQEMFRDTFPGRGVKAKFFDKFNPKLKNKVTTFLESQLKDRTGDILERAKAIQAGKQDLGIEKAGGVIDTTVTETVKETAVKRPPSETGVYTPVVAENLDIDVLTEKVDQNGDRIPKTSAQIKTEVDAVINEAIKVDTEATTGVTRFGQVKVGPKLAAVLGKAFNLNPKVFLQKGFNLSGNFENLRQYLLKNAQEDFSNLPEAYDPSISGKNRVSGAAFIPENVKREFYKKVEGTNKFELDKSKTVKDYINLLKESDGRSTGATTVKGLADLHFRNKIAEKLIKPSTRKVTGIKFSKRIDNAFQSAKIEKGSIDFSEYNINYNKTLNAFLKDTGVSRMDMTTESGRKRFLDFAVESGLTKKLPPSFWLSLAFTSDSALTEEIKQELKEAGIVGDAFTFDGSSLREFTGNLPFRNTIEVREWISKTGKENFAKETDTFSDMIKVEGVFAAKNNLENQLSNPDFVKRQDNSINELGNIFKLFQNKIMRNPDGTMNFKGVAFVGALLSSSSSGQNHFLRKAAPYRFYQKGYMEAGSSATTLEHTMPATIVGKYLFMQALNGSVNENFKYIKNNYFQGPLLKYNDKKLKGKKPNGDKFNYISTMPENWKVTDNVWARYFNINVANTNGGINPADIMLNKKESILDKFNIMSSGLVINEATKKQIPQVEALNNSSQPKSLASKRASTQQQIYDQGVLDEALAKGRRSDPEVKKIRVFDFDDTLATSKSMVIVNMRDGSSKKINATQFAKQAADLEANGAKFDFTEFSRVVKGKKGPLFDVAKKIADTRGTEDLFILTARPQDAAGPIKAFMKALGIDIPLGNITGLGDGTAAAKGMWIADKAAEGYNDFYFADDAVKNVKAVKDVLGQIDVKSKVQVAKASKRKTFDTVVNDMIELSSGIESYKKFSAAKAKTIGRDKGRFDFMTLASSAEDFKGLLYRLLGDGKQGEAQYEFLKTNLIDPYNRAEDAIVQAKISAANDFMALKEQFKGIPKTLETETGVGKFTYQHALRTYMWTTQGMSIPGLSKADARKLNKFIIDDAQLQAFANQLISIQKGKPYPEPGKDWLGGNLTTDIIGGINKVNRAEYQQQWRENVEIIFSPENLNKMEAAYGTRWRKALENSLKRMKAGTNRLGYNDATSNVLDWVNNSVGAVMFLNTRSAVLQTISAVNFINWGDNNIIKAGAAFANQKQFWSDFMKLMNSDYLTQRRNGLKINVSESEIADAVKDSKNKVKAAIAYLLSKGFVFTRYADSFAIASGGATFYRNRIKKYLKEGMSQELAQEKAFNDFRDIAEESQQSSSPDKISMQQASAAGRVILNWANTPMQYVRIQKRSLQDLIAGRGDAKVHVSRIAYYGVMQNLIFNALQQALFAIGFGDDDEDKAAKKKQDDKKIARVANGMIDSQLKGLGIAGAAMVAAKNTIMKIYEESQKNRPEFEKAAIEALSFSPAISSKYRKIVGGLKSFSWNRKEMKEKGFSLDNPAYLAGAQIITAVTNIPIDRVIKKANNIRGIMSDQSQMWQKVSMSLGWSAYDVGLPYYGGWDKPKEPTEAERKKQEIDVMKRDTNTAEQTQMLLNLGLTKKQIKALRYEDNRVKKIIELQKKKKDATSRK